MSNLKRTMALGIAAVIAVGAFWGGRTWLEQGAGERYFEDVTLSSGLASFSGMTFGSSWGDFDGDGLPDLYITNHLNRGALLRNLGGGRFGDVTDQFLSAEPPGADKHGSTWVDFDNDGDHDLLVLRGGGRGVGAEANLLFVAEGAGFAERADALGIANPLARTRMPLWVDLDRDGVLDLFMGALKRPDGQAPASMFMSRPDRFEAHSDPMPFATESVSFCILAEANGDGVSDLVCRVHEAPGKTAQIFSTATFPLKELPPFPPTHFEDAAAADFDGDGRLDLYLARPRPDPSVIVGQRGSNELFADVWISPENVKEDLGFTFESAGELSVRVVEAYPRGGLKPEQIHIGAKGLHPQSAEFTLSGEVAGVDWNPTNQPGAALGVFVGRDDAGKWNVRVSSKADFVAGQREEHHQLTFRIVSTQPISGARPIGAAHEKDGAPDRLYMNRPDGLREESEARGVNDPPVDTVNVVAGDFDNDMDVDLYLVATGSLANQENRLLVNRGDGTFDAVPGAGGASGGMAGVGDSVTTADFDGDGFLDLLVANGGSMGRNYGMAVDDGDYRLYRNVGNGNRWMMLDLEGTKSNRDGIGAFVYVTAGGRRQVRLQDGGIHNRGQNHQRLHFGLGPNETIDKVEIHWPSGTVQQLTGVASNQVLKVKEP